MEFGARPQPSPGNGRHAEHAQSQAEDAEQDTDRFADANTDSPLPGSADFVGESESAPECHLKAQASPPHADRAPSTSAEQLPEDTGSQVASAGDGGRRINNGRAKTLTLKIDVGARNGAADSPRVFSPLADDITLLLSPNHVYCLDWAAAMETPTPDPSSDDGPPSWTTSG